MRGISVVIPCYNEEDGIDQLFRQLQQLRPQIPLPHELILIDDGSTDQTYPKLQQTFANSATILRHPQNKNLGAALQTGMKAAKYEYIGFLDADCTYDPQYLLPLLQMCEAGADLALASPYHPEGKVVGVPAWRLFLSHTVSRIYSLILGRSLFTFTGMVRVFRREKFLSFRETETEFTFVTLMTLWALANNLAVAELPATLTTRQTGVSKLRTLRVIGKHLKILARKVLTR
jgi:dolichol-phosphate mannosyltransferase